MKHRPAGGKKKPIICITTGKQYDSVKEAAISLNVSAAGISLAVIRDTPVKGFLFTEATPPYRQH